MIECDEGGRIRPSPADNDTVDNKRVCTYLLLQRQR
jgi:hypothetical protein